MQFDDILKEVGEFGPYQKSIYFLLCLPALFLAAIDVLNAYLMYSPAHFCATEGSSGQLKGQPANLSSDYNSSYSFKYEQCRVTAISNSTNITSYSCSSWTYDETVFSSTFVSELNLVCDSALTSAYMQVIIHSGVLTGSVLQGFVSDRFGRKLVLCGSSAIAMVTGISSVFFTNIYIFTALRHIQSLCASSLYSTIFVLGVEFVGPSKRLFAGVIINFVYSTGLILLAGVAYGARDWKVIQIACSAPFLLFSLYWWIVPESPRWLISQCRYKEAKEIIHKIAKWNNREDSFSPEQLTSTREEHAPEKLHFCNLFSSWSIFIRCVIICVNWLAVIMAYFGFSLNAANLSGDFYLNHLIAGLVEFPANAVAIFLLDRIGRKRLFMLAMTLGGVCLLISGAVELLWPIDVLSVSFGMLGKFGLTISYAVVYVWSSELFPTGLRSTGLGLAIFVGGTGYMIAPYIIQLALRVPGFGRALPLFLFAGLSLVASFLTFLLPETTKEYLPETLQINIKRKEVVDEINQSKKSDIQSVNELNVYM